MSVEQHIQEHLEAVQAPSGTDSPVMAFFDLDQTLISGYSALALVWESLRSRHPGMVKAAREMLASIDRRDGVPLVLHNVADALLQLLRTRVP